MVKNGGEWWWGLGGERWVGGCVLMGAVVKVTII